VSDRSAGGPIAATAPRFRWLSGNEWIVAAFALIAFLLARRFGFAIDYGLALQFRHDVHFLELLVIAACAGAAISGSRAPRTLGDRPFGPLWRERFRREHLTVQRAWDVFRVLVLLKLLLVIYCNIKQAIPRIQPRLFDDELLRIDTALHFGVNPMLWAVHALGASSVVRTIDVLYVAWFTLKAPMIVAFLFARDRWLSARFFGACFTLWVAGALLAALIPSLGPVYTHPEWFDSLDKPMATHLQSELWTHDRAIRASPEEFRPYLFQGIAAFPSLHVGVAALFAFFLRRLNRRASIAMWSYTAIIEVGSVLLGWHYAIDGYFGILMAAILYVLFTRVRNPTSARAAS
jgi:hypothetical protein